MMRMFEKDGEIV